MVREVRKRCVCEREREVERSCVSILLARTFAPTTPSLAPAAR